MNKFKLIEDSIAEIVDEDFFDKIAKVAHNCYQVKDKDHLSNISFINRLVESKHLAMLEHYMFSFKIDKFLFDDLLRLNNRFIVLSFNNDYYLATLSTRVLLEAYMYNDIDATNIFNILIPLLPKEIINLFSNFSLYKPVNSNISLISIDNLKQQIDQFTYNKHKFLTYNIITDRGVTHELVRHRLCSFAQESTRYCNYTKDKFDNSLTFIKPLKYDEMKNVYDSYFNYVTECYFNLINSGATPEEARSVLPNSLKASIMVTASIEEWLNIIKLRTDSHAHPDINRVISKVVNDMLKKEYIDTSILNYVKNR